MALVFNEKLERAREQIEAARRARNLREFRCDNPDCRCKFGEYEPPVRYLLVKCRKCGLYSTLSTEPGET